MSHRMGKPTICIGENKGADQLRSNCKADQRLCFRYTNSTIPLLSKFKILQPLAICCGCTPRIVSDLVRTQTVGCLKHMLSIVFTYLLIKPSVHSTRWSARCKHSTSNWALQGCVLTHGTEYCHW